MQEQGTQTSTPLLTEIDVVGGAEQLLRADAEEFAHKQPPLVNASPLDLYFGLKAQTDCVLILDHLEAAATADHPLPNFANSAFLRNHLAYKQTCVN
jgi:hypothetical protein